MRKKTLIELKGVRFSSEWYGLVGASAQESVLLTQRTLLVSKVICSARSISTDPVLLTIQAINLNWDQSLSHLPTGYLAVYRDWKKPTWFLFLPSGSSLASLLPTTLCPEVWARLNFISSPLKRYTQACASAPKIDWGCLLPLFCTISSGSMLRTVALMLWHFHKEINVVGSVRQQGDIYIRKNGCCHTRGGKEVQKQACTAVITSPHAQRRFPTVILPDRETGKDTRTRKKRKKTKQSCNICSCSRDRKLGDGTPQG